MTTEAGDEGGRRGRAWRLAPWGVAALLLLLPWAAMQFREEVSWDGFDFLVAAVLLFGACGAFEVAARMSGHWSYRVAAGLAILAALLLVWINLAVGVIGSEDHPANLLYAGLLAIGVVGAAIARLRPGGMARVLVLMAVAQAMIGAAALLAGWGSEGENWPQVVIVLNGVFAAVWLVSAGLFRKAARARAPGSAAA